MRSLEALSKKDIVDLAKQGDPEAIAHIMSYHFRSKKMIVNVTYATEYILILIEASFTPQQEDVVPPIMRALKRLHLKNLKGVRIFGRRVGAVAADWLKQIDLTSSESFSTGLTLIDWLKQGEHREEKSASVAQDNESSTSDEITRFLNIEYSHNELAAVNLSHISEVIRISIHDILPIPQLPEYVLGIYNYRGSILTMVDLSQKLGKTSFFWQDHIYSFQDSNLFALVIQHEDSMLGFVIPKIIDIKHLEHADIEQPNTVFFTPSLLPFISGYVKDDITPILNLPALCV